MMPHRFNFKSRVILIRLEILTENHIVLSCITVGHFRLETVGISFWETNLEEQQICRKTRYVLREFFKLIAWTSYDFNHCTHLDIPPKIL